MSLLVIDISDKIEELGILFANLLEDCPLNESIQLQDNLNSNDHEQQDPISSPAENSLRLPQAIDHAPGYAQPGEYRAAICPQPESHRLWMDPFASPYPGWGPWPDGEAILPDGKTSRPWWRKYPWAKPGPYLYWKPHGFPEVLPIGTVYWNFISLHN